MHVYVIVMQINGIVMQIPAPLTLISTCFRGRTLLLLLVTSKRVPYTFSVTRD